MVDQLPRYQARSIREAGQRYYVNDQGIRLPSVTTILNATRSLEQRQALASWRQRVGSVEAQRITSSASRRGTGTHRQIQRYLEGEDCPCTDAVQPYWESVRPVLDQLEQVWLVEGYVCHPDLGYAGEVDCVATYRGVACVCEWKTSDRPKGSVERLWDYPLQLAAYCGAVNQTYGADGLRIQSALLVIAIPEQPAECFWFEPDSLLTNWSQWQERLLRYHHRYR